MICNECETVAHCTKHGCVPKQPAPVQPVALEMDGKQLTLGEALDEAIAATERSASKRLNKVLVAAKNALYTTPPAAEFVCSTRLCHYKAQRQWVGLTERELELIDGMIEVQLDHAARCDSIANRTMAEKQKGWDMERVALLQKLKEKSI
jgi:hypothetical protein